MRPDGHIQLRLTRKDRRIAGLLKQGTGIGASFAAGADSPPAQPAVGDSGRAGNPAIAFKTNGALTGRCQAKKLVSALNESARPESIGCWSRPDQASRRLGLQGALFETRPKIVMPSWVETG